MCIYLRIPSLPIKSIFEKAGEMTREKHVDLIYNIYVIIYKSEAKDIIIIIIVYRVMFLLIDSIGINFVKFLASFRGIE